jgi:hypothetical protein
VRVVMLGGAALAWACSEYGVSRDPAAASPEPTAGSPTEPVPSGPPPPVADAGPDLVRAPLEQLELDATRSYDPAGADIVAVAWALVEQPAGSTTRLSDPELPRPSLFLDLAGTYRLTLDVQNRPGLWDPTPDELVIEVVPEDELYVQLFWDAESDLDLHLLQAGAGLFGSGDCNFCNMSPDWGGRGPRDDPSLDWDAIFGFGPEAISIEEPADGTYEVVVHYYGEEGLDQCLGRCESSHASVLVYVDGVLAGKFARRLSDQGDLWRVATVSWPSGSVAELDELDATNQSFCQ